MNFEAVWLLPLSVAGFFLLGGLIIVLWIEPRGDKRPR
jgi:hypothetical protein